MVLKYKEKSFGFVSSGISKSRKKLVIKTNKKGKVISITVPCEEVSMVI